jgi:Xaa-Pro aminopeptidase
MLERIHKVRAAMPQEVDGLLVLQPENRRWVSGFTGTSGMAVIPRQGQPVFLTDFRYTQQAGQQCQGFDIVRHGQEIAADIKAVLGDLGITKLGIEKDYITVGQNAKWTAEMPGIELVPLSDILLDLRAVKDEGELELLAEAAVIADKAFAHILGFLKPGVSERRVALELERHMVDLGATGPSFETIVASGVRSSMPHGVASEKLLEGNDFITMDFGCIYEGYCSDMTRTVVLGTASPRQREIYDIVLEAQLAGVRGIRAGISGKEADALTRDIIAAKGYGEQFGHGTGHGVGLAIHESPRAGVTSQDTFVVNNIITVEPGIYIPDWGGVRIEDMLVVKAGGSRNFTTSPKELIEIK